MEILVLGSAANARIPQSDCMVCKTCKTALERGGLDKRTRSSLLIKNLDKYTLVDANPDLSEQLVRERIPTTQISEILLTHAHGDHIYGLFEMAVGRPLKMPVYSDKNILNIIFGERRVFEYLIQEDRVIPEELVIGERKKLGAGKLKIVPFEVVHTPKEILGPTLGYKFFEANKTFTYVPDISEFDKSAKKYIDNSNVLMIGTPMLEGRMYGHIGLKEMIPILQKMKIGKVYITHLFHVEPTHKELQNTVDPYGYTIAYDDMKIKI
jgi:phosphoribosyl 1,2-cyclic phosphodiesterase